MARRIHEGVVILLVAVGLFALLALLTYQPSEVNQPLLFQQQVRNAGGIVGAWFGAIAFYWLGYGAYLLPCTLFYAAVAVYWQPKQEVMPFYVNILKLVGIGLFLLTSTGLLSLLFSQVPHHASLAAGGWLGDTVAHYLSGALNTTGACLLLGALLLGSVTLLTGLSWVKLGQGIVRLGQRCFSLSYAAAKGLGAWFIRLSKRLLSRPRKKQDIASKPVELPLKRAPAPIKKKLERNAIAPIKVIPPKPDSPPTKKETMVITCEGPLPSLELLELPEMKSVQGYSEEVLTEISREVEARLADFGVEVKVVAVHPGPVVTRFEMELAPGVKVSKLSGLAKDLARSLSVTSVRIVEVIPGRPVVGLEVPNAHRETVRLREILASSKYQESTFPLSLALGKDIAGEPVVVNLAKMPHLLVAGTTGSGKSVGINAMLLSLLYKATPAEVRLILIDPKMLELSIYEGIPHLLAPVVTDMKEAANALRWCVAEMERRYRLMAKLGVRNLAGFNQKVKAAIEKGEPLIDPLWKPQSSDEEPRKLDSLPFIVVVIDELADMMMVVGKKVEELIARIAQKARAAGIHLILATQRPSVDVITGLIKANIPTRIAFQVSSRIDSRTILDQMGAEQLLGQGDMLYLAPGTGIPMRVHGAFVADQEVHAVVHAWQQRGQPEYLSSILQGDEEEGAGSMQDGGGESETDPLYDQAVKIVLDTRRASISSIQRRLKIGYNRAARLIEDMERAGLVSEMQSNGTREILVPESIE